MMTSYFLTENFEGHITISSGTMPLDWQLDLRKFSTNNTCIQSFQCQYGNDVSRCSRTEIKEKLLFSFRLPPKP